MRIDLNKFHKTAGKSGCFCFDKYLIPLLGY